MNKKIQLQEIANQIERCRICKKDAIGLPVPGEGNPHAQVVFIGEAPGKTEAKTGRPFVGRSGKLLRKLIVENGLKENEVYITSPVKYLPERGTPSKKQILHGKTHLDKQLEIINPKVIVLLGKTACTALLPNEVSLIKQHGTIVQTENRSYFITVHPAAALRFVKFKKILLEDFKKLYTFLK